MAVFAGFLRAVNVGGTGRITMPELRVICENLGFRDVATYIQSGNVVFSTSLDAGEAASRLAGALAAYLGKSHDIVLRRREELEAVLAASPFGDKPGNQVAIFFFAETFDQTALEKCVAPDGEAVAIVGREVHIWYPKGMGRSKLKLAGLAAGTARNLNTIRTVAEMAQSADRS